MFKAKYRRLNEKAEHSNNTKIDSVIFISQCFIIQNNKKKICIVNNLLKAMELFEMLKQFCFLRVNRSLCTQVLHTKKDWPVCLFGTIQRFAPPFFVIFQHGSSS